MTTISAICLLEKSFSQGEYFTTWGGGFMTPGAHVHLSVYRGKISENMSIKMMSIKLYFCLAMESTFSGPGYYGKDDYGFPWVAQILTKRFDNHTRLMYNKKREHPERAKGLYKLL